MDGTYDDVNRLASELAGEHEDWAFVNVNVRPYYAEGSKTLGFEIAEQLGWRLPEQVVVPIASGAQLVKVDKGFSELTSLGLVADDAVAGVRRPGQRLLAGVRRVRGRARRRAPGRGRPRSPSRWPSATRPTGPTCWTWCAAPAARSPTSSDDEVVDSIRLLAAVEGIFGETAGGVTLGVLRKLLADGPARPGGGDGDHQLG